MFSLAITLTTRIGSGKAVGRQAQAFFERDARPPAEQRLRRADVGPRVADVTGTRVAVVLLDRTSYHLADGVGELVDRHRAAGRDVEDRAAPVGRVRREDRRLDHVRDVREVARLRAVSVDGER